MTSVRASTRWATRWPVWVFAAALLLKAAMPWLASESAQLQGKTAFEICSVHGVSIDAASAGKDMPAPERSSQRSEHCALTALGALATAEAPLLSPIPVLVHEAGRPRSHTASDAPDASATWIARRKHGPPAHA